MKASFSISLKNFEFQELETVYLHFKLIKTSTKKPFLLHISVSHRYKSFFAQFDHQHSSTDLDHWTACSKPTSNLPDVIRSVAFVWPLARDWSACSLSGTFHTCTLKSKVFLKRKNICPGNIFIYSLNIAVVDITYFGS